MSCLKSKNGFDGISKGSAFEKLLAFLKTLLCIAMLLFVTEYAVLFCFLGKKYF
jgi:hypothetical protein